LIAIYIFLTRSYKKVLKISIATAWVITCYLVWSQRKQINFSAGSLKLIQQLNLKQGFHWNYISVAKSKQNDSVIEGRKSFSQMLSVIQVSSS